MVDSPALGIPLPPKSQPPLAPKDEDRVKFHMAEFSALKAEVAELVKVASSNLQYALATSGGVTAWLLSAKAPKGEEKLLFSAQLHAQMHYAFLLPLLLALAFATLAFAAYRRIGHKAEYLKLLESWLRAAGLGWERKFEHRTRMLGWLYGATWVGLLAFDAIVASLAFHSYPAPEALTALR